MDYDLFEFGGANGNLVTDPTDSDNIVVEFVKTAGAETFAGVTVGQNGLANRIPLTAVNTVLSVRVWSPEAGTPVRLKVENAGDPTVSVETEDTTTVAMQWETLTFDFTQQAQGTAAFDPTNIYSKVVVFMDFGSRPETAATYYFDDIRLGEGGGTMLNPPSLPITFEDTATVDYDFVPFAGAAVRIVTDPVVDTNTVLEFVKTAGSQLFAGVTIGENGLSERIPLDANNSQMSVRVWSPRAGTPVRLKVENAATPQVSVETEQQTTLAGEWETLVFDFSDNVEDTPVLDGAALYNKVVVFMDFGSTPTEATTYYVDDITFGDAVSVYTTPEVGLLQAFPNPTHDRVRITAPVRMEQVSLYSINGALINTWSVHSDQLELDMRDLKPGLYVALATAPGRAFTVKLLKE